MHIPLNTEGHISNSAHPEHYVLVRDDFENTGGLLVFEWWKNSTGPNANGAFDSWIEDAPSLERFFAESAWIVEWKNQLNHRP